MEVIEARRALDETLLRGTLSNRPCVARLVNDQVRSTAEESGLAKGKKEDSNPLDGMVNQREQEAWRFLELLQSVSGERLGKVEASNSLEATESEAKEWKLKEDTGRMRVLYRKGPEGTAFHSFCLEGIIDASIPHALCVAWEAPYFREWWPEFSVPPFRITESRWLRRIRTGEDLALVRFKVPWPFAPREVALRAFSVECFDDNILFAIMKTIPDDLDGTDEAVDGYKVEDIPPPGEAVRIGMDGGYIFYRYSSQQCYFRTIVEMDVKLPMVPPWVIDFVSRPLSCSGYKLFQKTVKDVAGQSNKGRAHVFRQLIGSEPLYRRVASGFASAPPPPSKPITPRDNIDTRQVDRFHPATSSTGSSTASVEHSQAQSETPFASPVGQSRIAPYPLPPRPRSTFSGLTPEGSNLYGEALDSSAPGGETTSFSVSSTSVTGAGSAWSTPTSPAWTISTPDSELGSVHPREIRDTEPGSAGGRRETRIQEHAKWRTEVAVDPEVERAVESIDRMISLVKARGQGRRNLGGDDGRRHSEAVQRGGVEHRGGQELGLGRESLPMVALHLGGVELREAEGNEGEVEEGRRRYSHAREKSGSSGGSKFGSRDSSDASDHSVGALSKKGRGMKGVWSHTKGLLRRDKSMTSFEGGLKSSN